MKIEKEIKIISTKLNYLKRKNKVSLALNEFIVILKKFRLNQKIIPNTKHFKKLWGVYNQNVLLHKL